MTSFKAMHYYFLFPFFHCYFESCHNTEGTLVKAGIKLQETSVVKKKCKKERKKKKRKKYSSGLTTRIHEVNTSLSLSFRCVLWDTLE